MVPSWSILDVELPLLSERERLDYLQLAALSGAVVCHPASDCGRAEVQVLARRDERSDPVL